jgi:hypothetical protein
MESTQLIYMYLALAFLISKIPFLNVYFALINTLLHEVFHVIFAAFLRGGIRHKIRLESDASGLALTNISASVPKVLVYFAGYTGSSLSSLVLFYFLHIGQFNWIIYFFITISLISVLLWIRNLYGICWAISFITLLSVIIYIQNEIVIMHTSMFLSAVVLLQSILSAFTVFKRSLIQRKNAGDATSLAKATFIPAVVWGALFFGQSLFAGYFILKNFLI